MILYQCDYMIIKCTTLLEKTMTLRKAKKYNKGNVIENGQLALRFYHSINNVNTVPHCAVTIEMRSKSVKLNEAENAKAL